MMDLPERRGHSSMISVDDVFHVLKTNRRIFSTSLQSHYFGWRINIKLFSHATFLPLVHQISTCFKMSDILVHVFLPESTTAGGL